MDSHTFLEDITWVSFENCISWKLSPSAFNKGWKYSLHQNKTSTLQTCYNNQNKVVGLKAKEQAEHSAPYAKIRIQLHTLIKFNRQHIHVCTHSLSRYKACRNIFSSFARDDEKTRNQLPPSWLPCPHACRCGLPASPPAGRRFWGGMPKPETPPWRFGR